MSSCRGRCDRSSRYCSAASSAEISPSTFLAAFRQSEEETIPKLEWGPELEWGPGAGGGNRTHVASLEGWNSTIELHPLEWPSETLHQAFDPAAIPEDWWRG